MAATLDVTITNGATTYALQVESANVSYRRAVMHQAMPGGIDPIQVDIGFSDPAIRLSGIAPISDTSDGTNTVPSKNNLEDLVTNSAWYGATIDLTVGGDTYECKVASANFDLKPGTEDQFWGYTLNFVAKLRQ